MLGAAKLSPAILKPCELFSRAAQELATYLEVPINTLYRWRHRGEGPTGFRVGRYVRYRSSDVDRWIQQQLDRVS